jgi:PAS domain S-box-containing protein
MEREARGENGEWYLVRLRPYRTLEDRIDGVVITFVDITARKQAEETIRRSEETYRLLVESLPEYAIFLMDREGRIISWNKGAERVLGYSESEILGRSVVETFSQEDRKSGVLEKEMQAAAEAGHLDEDHWHVRKDGVKFWGTGVLAALYDKTGQLRGYAKILRDNTERRAAEEALHRSQAELEQAKERLELRVEQRTKQVRALARALTLAEQQERVRISRVLHDDLQQVLYGLEVKAQMMEQQIAGAKGGDLQAFLKHLDKMVHKAIETTRNLTVELNPPVLKHEGLFEALRWLKTHMKKSFNLEVEIAGRCPVMEEDTRSLAFQLVRELLFNVVKHAGVSRSRVELGAQDGHCVIRVIDEGKGFDPKTLEPTEQAHPGLGLASAAERVKLFGGRLEVDSVPGDGTRVTIGVPLVSREIGLS